MLEKLRKRDRKITQIRKQLESLTLQGGVAVASNVQEEIAEGIERGGCWESERTNRCSLAPSLHTLVFESLTRVP
jgi:hypothetical protein